MNGITVVLIASSGLQQDNNVHWFLACINFKEKRTEVYDSMGSGRHEQVHKTLLRWLGDEHQDKVSRVSVSLSLSLFSPFPPFPTVVAKSAHSTTPR